MSGSMDISTVYVLGSPEYVNKNVADPGTSEEAKLVNPDVTDVGVSVCVGVFVGVSVFVGVCVGVRGDGDGSAVPVTVDRFSPTQ